MNMVISILRNWLIEREYDGLTNTSRNQKPTSFCSCGIDELFCHCEGLGSGHCYPGKFYPDSDLMKADPLRR